jgi:putative ABC transport system permease protein
MEAGYIMNSIAQDFRYSIRMLQKNRGFFIYVLIILAIGIGATTAIFTLINAVLLKPLSFADPDQLVTIWEINREKGLSPETTSASNFIDWSDRNRTFSGMAAASRIGSVTLLDHGPAEEISWCRVSPNYFDLLGVNPLLGKNRLLQPDQIAISYGFWSRDFGKDPNVIGRTIRLDNQKFEIAAVLPNWFESPAGKSDIWAPLILNRNDLEPIDRGQNYLRVFGRLKSNFNIDQAQEDVDQIAKQLSTEFAVSNRNTQILLVGLKDQIVGKVKPTLYVAFAAVVSVFLIACANIAILMLMHFARRNHEIAIRSALGASRKNIATQLFIESLLISICGGLIGILFARLTILFLLHVNPEIMPRLTQVQIDWTSIAFTFIVSVIGAVFFGVLPAIRGSQPAQSESWKIKDAAVSQGTKNRLLQNKFIVFEIAIGLFLLIGAGLFIRSFIFLSKVDPGFQQQNLLVARLRLDAEYSEKGTHVQYFTSLLNRLRNLPGVTNAGAVTVLPMNTFGIDFDVPYYRAEDPNQERATAPKAKFRSATSDYFRTMGIAVLEGRTFLNSDDAHSPGVVIINDELAKKIYPASSAVGKKIRFFWSDWQTYEIVGVVGSTHTYGPLVNPEAELFVPFAQIPYVIMNVVVRTTTQPENMIAAVRLTVLEIDPKQPVLNIEPMPVLVKNSTLRERYAMFLISSLSIIGLILASTGIYATVYFAVIQRKAEMGIRMALGATSRDVLKIMIKPVFTLAIIGISLGLSAILVVSPYLSSILFGLTPTDKLTLISVSLLMLSISVIAAFVPARHLLKLDAAVVLRYE